MDIMILLEKLANSAHHHVVIEELISELPCEVREAFLTNNTEQLKNQFGNSSILADKSMVVQI